MLVRSSPPPVRPPLPNRKDRLDSLLEAEPSHRSLRGAWDSTRDTIRDLMIPKNVEKTMTPDYLPTRFWWLGRELMGNLSYGFAASQATTLALELVLKSQPGVAVATVGMGLGMYWFPKVVDQIRNGVSVASSTLSPVVDRRPKAWFLAGDVLDNSGTAIMSCAALAPGLYAPLTLGVGAAFTVAGVLKRRAQSNMFYRQALNPRETLPDINTKESNQSIVLNLASLAAGAGIQRWLGESSLAWGLPLVGLATAALGVLTSVQFLRNLDMETVNEATMRSAFDSVQKGDPLPAPNRSILKLPGQLCEHDRIQMGRDLITLKQAGAGRYEDLRKLYQDQKYLLESFKGEPYIVLKEGVGNDDLAAAMMQALHLEKLRESPDYAAVLEAEGSDRADAWLVEQSLSRAREQAPGLLEKLKGLGWATDLVNFRDDGERYSDEDLQRPLPEGEVALP